MAAKKVNGNNSTNRSDSQSNLEELEEKTLYCALQKIGVYNITTLMKRLEIPSINESQSQSSEKSKEAAFNKDFTANSPTTNKVRENSIQLLKLMGLSEANECVCLLEKICLQGREMLGEISKPTIASAPMSKSKSEYKAAFSQRISNERTREGE